MSMTLKGLISKVVKNFEPPPKMTINEWANKYRYLSSKSSARPGKYNSGLTPWIPGILDAVYDKNVVEVVGMKSAQVAWTDGVMNNTIGYNIHLNPVPMMILFPKGDDAKGYSKKKLKPMIEVTPVLRERVNISSSRGQDNTTTYKEFDGGYIQLVGSNSTGNVKSDPVPHVYVEEPDDCNTNVGDQGDSISLIRERMKTFDSNRKMIFGGTPKVKGLSRVESSYRKSDRRKFYVPCHECGEKHVLHWENVKWDEAQAVLDEVYGNALWETAFYACPHCGVTWDDAQKNRNVRKGEWIAEGEFKGVAGFYINELYSPFEASRLKHLVKKYLEARYEERCGNNKDIIVFTNSTLGLPYEFGSSKIKPDDLRDKTTDEYSELECPARGLAVTVGVDIQHDRLAIIMLAWGRNNEVFVIYWGEIYAKVSTTDINDPVWNALDDLVFAPIKHQSGVQLYAKAISIDCSDGNTSDAGYDWVRTRSKTYSKTTVRAIKGSSATTDPEIYSPGKKIDTKKSYGKQSKADKKGISLYMVGTNKAKDWVFNQLKLLIDGVGRFNIYKGIRDDFFDQVLGEVKAPHRSVRNRDVWQQKPGCAVEALDGTVYALHAARGENLHRLSPAQWDALEAKITQADMFSAPVPQPQPEHKKVEQPVPAQTIKVTAAKASNGSMSDLARRLNG